MDTVHPKFWELKEDFEDVKENVKQTTDSCTELCSELESTQGHLHCLMDDTKYLRQNLESTQEQINQTREDQVNTIPLLLRHLFEFQSNNNRKNWSFVEDALKSVPRKHEIEALYNELEEMKKEVQKEIEDSKHTVKFDLLHDPSPQVDHLKVILFSVF